MQKLSFDIQPVYEGKRHEKLLAYTQLFYV